MRKIKILIVIFICFILTGCKVEYNLELKGDTFYERGIFTFGNSKADIHINNVLKNKPMAAFSDDLEYNNDIDDIVSGVRYYDKKVNKNVIEVSYKYSKDDIIKSSLTNSCYNQIFKEEYADDSSIVYVTSTPMECYALHTDIEEIKFNLKLDRKAIETNADYNKGNVYTWIFKPEDTKKNVYIKIPNKKETKILNNVTITVGIVLIIFGILLLYISFKHKKVNNF